MFLVSYIVVLSMVKINILPMDEYAIKREFKHSGDDEDY